jgi:hypothetical protein
MRSCKIEIHFYPANHGHKIWAVKLTSVPASQDMARLEHVGQLVKADRCLLVSRTADQIRGRSVASLNLPAVIEHLLG